MATASRERFKSNMRKAIAYGYCGTIEALRLLGVDTTKVIQHVIYYPGVKDNE